MADTTISITFTEAQFTRVQSAFTVQGSVPDANGIKSELTGFIKNRVKKYEEAVATQSVNTLDI
jgi:hypothetical protein